MFVFILIKPLTVLPVCLRKLKGGRSTNLQKTVAPRAGGTEGAEELGVRRGRRFLNLSLDLSQKELMVVSGDSKF